MSKTSPTAETTKNPRQRFPLMAWLVMGLVLIVGYPLSLGPGIWLLDHNYIPEFAGPVIAIYLAPIHLYEFIPGFTELMQPYVNWWWGF